MAPSIPCTPPSQEAVRRARLYWEQSRQDHKEARRRLRRGAYLESGYVSLQAAVNGLAAVCYLHGHFQLPLSSPTELLALCREADTRFEELHDACHALEEASGHDLFNPPAEGAVDKAACRTTLDHCETVLSTVRGYLKENRARFFAP